jgi:hypothetical protein
MYVQIDCLGFRTVGCMHVLATHTLSLCRPTVPSIAAARDYARDGHSDKRTPLPRPSRAITGIFGEIGKSGEQVRTLRESRNSLLYPTSCWVQWLIKRPMSHPCLTTTY